MERKILCIIIFIGIFLVVSIAVLNPVDNKCLSFILIIALFLMILAPVWTRHKIGDIAEPIYYISLLYFLYFIVRAVWILFYPSEMYSYYWGNRPEASYDVINTTLAYTIIGFMTLFVGYSSSLPEAISRLLWRPKFLKREFKSGRISLDIIIVLIYCIGLFARFYLISRGQATFLLNPYEDIGFLHSFQLLEELCIFAYGLLTARLLTNPSKGFRYSLWIVMLIIETCYGFYSGKKGFIIPIVAVSLILYHYLHKAISVRSAFSWLGIIFIAFILIIFPIINSYRVQFYKIGGYSSPDIAISTLSVVISELVRGELSYSLTDSTHDLMNRFVGLDAFSIIIESKDYQKGKTISLFFWAFIPRFIWPDKPSLDVGREFAITMWNQPANVQSSMAPTSIGELYWNFGLIGVVLGMFVLGVIYRIVYIYLIKDRKRVSANEALLYAFAFLGLFGIEGNLASQLAHIIQKLLLFGVTLWFISLINRYKRRT